MRHHEETLDGIENSFENYEKLFFFFFLSMRSSVLLKITSQMVVGWSYLITKIYTIFWLKCTFRFFKSPIIKTFV